MDVLDDDEQRCGRGQVRAHLRERLKEPPLLLLRVGFRRDREIRDRPRNRRDELREIGRCAPEQIVDCCGRATGNQPVEQIEQGRIRERAIRLEAIALHDRRCGLGGLREHRRLQFRDEPRLANARFPGDEGDPPAAYLRPLHERA